MKNLKIKILEVGTNGIDYDFNLIINGIEVDGSYSKDDGELGLISYKSYDLYEQGKITSSELEIIDNQIDKFKTIIMNDIDNFIKLLNN